MEGDKQQDETKCQKECIQTFYQCFQNLDWQGMNNLYHEDVMFSDPGFGQLDSTRTNAMWEMLCENAQDFKLEFKVNSSSEAHWEAWYTFSQTGRPVHNIIEATFTFKDGKIIRHDDLFDLHKWASQALGFKGWLLGGTGFFRKKLHAQTARMLDKFQGMKNNQ